MPGHDSTEPMRVLYVAGVERSGSTLLGKALGQLPGAVSVGEITHVWLRGLAENQRCGCGEPFEACPFWTGVGRFAFGGWTHVNPGWAADLQARTDRHRYLPWLMQPFSPVLYRAALSEYTALLARTYKGILATSGARVVVDTSKSTSMAWLLSRSPDIDLRVIHLVRDSRGVANSWQKKVRRPEITDTVEYMPAFPPSRLAARWNLTNGLLQAMRLSSAPTLRIRYEDFVGNPLETMESVAAFSGLKLDARAESLFARGEIPRETTHEVSGNPMRFGTGPIRISPDNSWRRSLSRRDQAIVSVLTSPGLAAYGYRAASDAAVGLSKGDSPRAR